MHHRLLVLIGLLLLIGCTGNDSELDTEQDLISLLVEKKWIISGVSRSDVSSLLYAEVYFIEENVFYFEKQDRIEIGFWQPFFIDSTTGIVISFTEAEDLLGREKNFLSTPFFLEKIKNGIRLTGKDPDIILDLMDPQSL